MIILGIDPGYAIVGYGVLEFDGNKFKVIEYGAVTTDASMNMFDRLKSIYDDINDIIERTRPDFMAIEELFFNSNQKTAINVAQARGVLLLAAMNHSVEIFEYTPLQVKQAVAGYGRADKNQVQQMVKLLLGLKEVPKPDDTADAVAIAICHGHSYNPRRTLRGTDTKRR
ncbi:MAG: crossover junction endodeoxyribonuclease RuvC [Clostridia bacterium]|nr:crossover junction endodeoxyribonuclease RuvC [Clostridia bacterium]